MGKKKYTETFKLEAVLKVVKQGRTSVEVSENLNIHIDVLEKWIDLFKRDKLTVGGLTYAEIMDEIERLKQKSEQLEEDIKELSKPNFAEDL